jgi:hypothetical protein
VGGESVFSVILCGSVDGKNNKLPMDEDAIRRELEHSGDDDYTTLEKKPAVKPEIGGFY